MKKLQSFSFMLAVAAIFQACTPAPEPPVVTEQDQLFAALKEVNVDTVSARGASNQILLTGKIVPDADRQIKIYAPVSGTVTKVFVHTGYSVKSGQTLAELKSGEMANFDSELSGAEATLASARRNLTAQEDLLKGGLAAEKDVEEARNEFKRATSQLKRAEQVLQINGGDRQANYKISSPIGGFVIEKNLTDHMQLRGDNGEPVFVIADISTVWATVNIYETDISYIHQGDSVALTTISYPGKVITGTIDKIYQMLDPETKTMRARINIKNDDLALKPEMFVTAKVLSKSPTTLLSVSDKALIFDNDKYYAVLRTPDGPKITQVEIAEKMNGRVFIKSGLKEGDQVVTTRQLYFYEAIK
ncbi:MAG: efflux RND transporter periplasmic adaptor subunit [Chitinophagaceae bacterium]|nr:MAG: efflux RND transporter periplasmic adaptor subunit [Chitinophagaceae bacterium]